MESRADESERETVGQQKDQKSDERRLSRRTLSCLSRDGASAKRTTAKRTSAKTWVFVERRDARTTEAESVEVREREWASLEEHDQRAYAKVSRKRRVWRQTKAKSALQRRLTLSPSLVCFRSLQGSIRGAATRLPAAR